VELPHRFVPTASKFVSPVRIVSQTGHRGSIAAMAFSPCQRYIAASDSDCTIKIWCIDNLDVIGSYRIGFVATELVWDGNRAVDCKAGDKSFRIEFETEAEDAAEIGGVYSRAGYIPLLGAPEFEYNSEKVTVRRGEDVYEHALSDAFFVSMEPCERYVVAVSKESVEIYDTSSENVLCALKADAGDAWKHVFFAELGNYIMAVSENTVWQFDPIREQPACIVTMPARVTAQCFSKKGLLALGNINGNLTLISGAKKAIVLRTPRFAKSFCAMFPSPDKAGFVAFRDESVTAFMGVSQEILSSAPLPAPLRAACAGNCYTEAIAACDDDFVYRLKLDTNDIVKLARVTDKIRLITCSGEQFAAVCENKVIFYNGSSVKELGASPDDALAIALNEASNELAILYQNRVERWSLSKNQCAQSVEANAGCVVFFGKEKSAGNIFVITQQLDVLSASSSASSLEKINALDDPALLNARPISAAPAAKSFEFVLCEINHGQYAVVRVGLNSGKSNIVQRVFVAGMQIWGAAANEQSVQLRNDATCLRIVQGLTTFSVDDWSRSEPLAIY